MSKSNYITWLEKSEDNLRWAEDNLKIKNYALVCYLSQQSVEFMLKGDIYFKGKIPPKTHQLLKLVEICKELELDLNNFLEELAVLSEYYFESRYPNSSDRDLDREEVARKAIDSSEKIVEFVRKNI